MKKTFPQRLAQLQGNRNVSEFARFLGIPQASVDRYLKGQRTPTGEIIYQICKKANISADWLLGLSDSHSPPSSAPPFPERGLLAAEPEDEAPPSGCRSCEAKDEQIRLLTETLHALSMGRSTPDRTSTSARAKY